MTTVLRRLACEANRPATLDCCVNPGFCQRVKQKQRTCSAISGCYGHNPQLRLYAAKPGFQSVRAVTMLRDPVSRVVSAWHYRCHSPNFDCYDVPGATKWALQARFAKKWKLPVKDWTPPPNVTFFDYVSSWPQYHNIQTRMIGKDAFPYASVPVDATDLVVAKTVLDTKFALVGLFELFDHSVALLAHLAGVPVVADDFTRVRASHSSAYNAFTAALRQRPGLVGLIRQANAYDHELHDYARSRLCRDLRAAGLLGRTASPSCPSGPHSRPLADAEDQWCPTVERPSSASVDPP